MSSVLLTGANGVVGYPLCQRLELDRVSYHRVSRIADSGHVSELQWDLQQVPSEQLLSKLKSTNTDTVIHCAPIWLLPNHLKTLFDTGIRRIIAFSSSSIISKKNSNDVSEHRLVEQPSDAEEALKIFCGKREIALTIFRPSMIYGYSRDQNITHIAKFIQRYGFMLLVGQGNGLRQPVHADDLVEASLSILENPTSFGRTYVLAGAEILTYREMVERIFMGLNKRSRILSLPLVMFRLALKTAALFGRFSYTSEMADRMNQNLNYDIIAAQKDFSYAPQNFLSQPERDLP